MAWMSIPSMAHSKGMEKKSKIAEIRKRSKLEKSERNPNC
jgi:hypothetical protein